MLSLSHRCLGIPPVGDAPTYPVGQPRVSTVADTALNYFCSNLDTPPNKLGRSPNWTRVFPFAVHAEHADEPDRNPLGSCSGTPLDSDLPS
jgi:hypothetical protein